MLLQHDSGSVLFFLLSVMAYNVLKSDSLLLFYAVEIYKM
jgi:hypothetical protein